MDKPVSQYDIGLDKTPANFVPLSPISFLERSAHVYPSLTSVVHEERKFTWGQTYDRCRRFASWLARQGIGRGDTVAAMLPNIPAMYEAHFAVPMAGAVLNALNTRLDAGAIAFMLEHGGAKILLVDPEFSDRDGRRAGAHERPKAARRRRGRRSVLRRPAHRTNRVRGHAGVRRSELRLVAAARRMGRDCAGLHVRHHGQSQRRRHASSRRVSQRSEQHPLGRSRPASGLSLDAADVPLQRLVLPMDDCGRLRR